MNDRNKEYPTIPVTVVQLAVEGNMEGGVMKFVVRWIKVLAAGLLVGLVAALVMTLVQTLLRLVLGIPLPAELGGDRFLPTFSVGEFLKLLSENGGPIASKRMAFLSGFGAQLAFGTAFGVLYAAIAEIGRSRNPERNRRFGVGPGGAFFVAVAVVVIWVVSLAILWPTLGTNNRGLTPGLASVATAAGFLVTYAIYGFTLVLIYRLITNRRPLRHSAPVGEPMARRAFLVGLGGVAVAAASGGLVKKLYDDSSLPYDGQSVSGPGLETITPNDKFYVVTKNIIDPVVRKSAWRLEVGGLVDKERTFGFEDLASMPSVRQEMTLECISNPVGGHLISNAVWKGVPLRRLIEAAGPGKDAKDVILHAADGYTHDITFDKAMEETTLVAYEMNDEPLSDRHGYPARVLVPGYYGEGSAKWVTRIELFDRNVEDRYYGKQGWKSTRVHTFSRFDVPTTGGETLKMKDGKIHLKGIAFAGDRGINKVEVTTDGGDTWNRANLDYTPSKIAWVFWSYDWKPEKTGEYNINVRATDGEGSLQVEEHSSINPDGSTGWNGRKVTVKA